MTRWHLAAVLAMFSSALKAAEPVSDPDAELSLELLEFLGEYGTEQGELELPDASDLQDGADLPSNVDLPTDAELPNTGLQPTDSQDQDKNALKPATEAADANAPITIAPATTGSKAIAVENKP